MKHTSIINKLVLFIILSSIAIAGVTNVINSKYLINEYKKELDNSNQEMLNALSSEFEGQLKIVEGTIETVSLLTKQRFSNMLVEMPNLDEEELYFEGMFSRYLLEEDAITESIYIYFDPYLDGNVHDVWMTKHENDIAYREIEISKIRFDNNDNMSWFNIPRDTKMSQWVDPYFNRYNQRVTSYVAPIYMDGNFLGITGMYVDFKELEKKLDTVRNFEGDMIWLINNDSVFYHPYHSIGTKLSDIVTLDKDEPLQSQSVLTMNNRMYYCYYNTLSNGWTFVYSVPLEKLDEKIDNLISLVLLVSGACFVILIIFIQFFSRKYKRVFKHIIITLTEIKRGNLGKRITVFTNDEIGMMAEAINESNDNLLRNIEEKNFLAYYNTMTSIPNRNSLTSDLSNYLDQERITDVVLVYVDIDNFRNINELIGYSQGNVFIKKVASILETFENGNIRLYHTNVDEFVYLIKIHHDDMELLVFTESILSQFGKNFSFGYHSFYLTVSIGMARYNEKIKTTSDFYRIADIAIFEAKKSGRNKCVTYDETMYDRLIQFNTLERDFERSLENEEFLVYYQPQIKMDDLSIISAEALVRWLHPDKGLLYPNYFIEYAEKSGLISKLGDIVLRKACEQTLKWRNEGLPNLKIAINISKRQITDNDFVSRTMEIINEVGLSPEYIEFEITESMLTVDSENTIAKLKQLKEFGIKISLDDFGTGYSSFNSLYELPIDIIKIDKGLVDNVVHSEKIAMMLESIIDLAHKLDLEVIAEGVEYKEQIKALEVLSCDVMQGFYFAKPLDNQSFFEYYFDIKE